jgi:serine/threonine protein kinase
MGVVYKAFDSVLRRDVAIKTLLDVSDPAALQLFQREYEVLAHINHPNIVEIIDIGEFEIEGASKPYFIMPLLPGISLGQLIRTASHRLTVERAVDIISQTCRGLNAAHEKGLVHRDMKPTNIIVMEDDSVKIIDFGVAHVPDSQSRTGWKGTLLYMAPEQIEMKPASALSDIFSLGVVAYETLTRRRPFEGATDREVVEIIRHHIPPPASELNPMVSPSVARVVHKAMAKQPYHRFSTARDFGDTLQRALRNEPIEIFDPVKIRPRIQRAMKAFEQADYQFAAEILGELEAEGHIDQDMTLLRLKVDQALRQKRIQQLLESARTRMEGQEYPLALQKVQEALDLDQTNAGALSLKSEIEEKRSSGKIEDWLSLARQHLDNHAYSHAREALKNVLQLKPKDARAGQLLNEVDRREQDYQQIHTEKQQFYQQAVEAWSHGEVSAALSKMQHVLELDQRAPDTSVPERAASYQSFYNQVRSEHDSMNSAYEEARKLMAASNFAGALAVCDRYLAKYPGHALFQALKFDIEEKQRQELSSRIAEIDRRVEAEPNLDNRVDILKEALELYPSEQHFERALRLTRDKRDLVNSIVAKARLQEERGQFTDAVAQWEILRTIYSPYPGLAFEIDRLAKRREQQALAEAKARWVKQIDQQMAQGDYERALDLLRQAAQEFPGDAELAELEKLIQQGKEQAAEALRLLAEGQEAVAAGRIEEGLEILRRAHLQDEAHAGVRKALVDALAERAQAVLQTDWRAAEPLLQEALELDPGHSLAKNLSTLAQDRKREEFIQLCVAQARRAQASGDIGGALTQVQEGLTASPADPRLSQLYATLTRENEETRRRQGRGRDLEETRRLEKEAESSLDPVWLRTAWGKVQSLSSQHQGDREFQTAVADAARHFASRIEAVEVAKPVTPVPVPPTWPAAGPAAGEISPPRQPLSPPSAPAPVAETSWGKTAAVPPPPAPAGPKSGFDVYSFATGGVGAEPPAAGTIREAPTAAMFPPPGTLATPAAPPEPVSPPGASATFPVPLGQPQPAPVESPGYTSREGEFPLAPTVTPTVPPTEESARPQAGKKILWAVPGLAALLVILFAAFLVPRWLRKQRARQEAAGAAVTPSPAAPPQLAGLKVYADLENAKVTLDGNVVGSVEGGQFNLDNLSDGQHSLEITDGASDAKISLASPHDSMPRLEGPLETKDLKAIVVTSGTQQSQVVSSFGPMQVSMDGQQVGQVSSTPLDLPNLSSGTHDLVLGTGKEERKVSFQVGAAPALTLFLSADRNVGILLVVAGEDGATVSLDGKKYPRTTKHGQLVIANLEPRQYKVAVAKDGFQTVPAQEANIQKGQEAKLVFALQPVPTVASLVIAGAIPAAEVLLDGKSLGAIAQDGSFSASNIKPGPHTVSLKKATFKPKELQEQFVAGGSVRLSASDVALESAAPARPNPALVSAKLIVQTVPGAQVSLDGQAVGQAGANGRLEIAPAPAGDHTLEITAKPYADFKEKLTLSPGGTSTITPSLMASMPVTHKHTRGSCEGTLLVGQGRVQYKTSDGNDSFDYPLSWLEEAGSAEGGKGFFLDFAGAKHRFGFGGGKHYVFLAPAADADLQIIQHTLPKQ